MINRIAILFILTWSLFSCSDNAEQQMTGNTLIQGTLSNHSGVKSMALEELTANKVNLVDSVFINENGGFLTSFDAADKGFYRLKASDKNFLTLIVSPEDQITINANAANLEGSYSVEGSEESKRLKSLNRMLNSYFGSMDSLKRAIQSHQASRDVNSYVQAMQFQNMFNQKLINKIKSFVDEQPASLASLAAVEKLDQNKDFSYYKKVADGLASKMPESSYYKSLQARVDEWKKLAVGSVAPDISLPDPNGTTVPLSSLRGKVVLVDFWASWCKPCRQENPNVVRMYNKYKDEGFEIYGISLDKNKQAWLKAIQQDQLTWLHVSDLKFWNSVAAKLYKVNSIPQTYLLDEEGKIIGKNLRGKALEQKLEEIFGQA